MIDLSDKVITLSSLIWVSVIKFFNTEITDMVIAGMVIHGSDILANDHYYGHQGNIYINV